MRYIHIDTSMVPASILLMPTVTIRFDRLFYKDFEKISKSLSG